jgi:hypothetical protein
MSWLRLMEEKIKAAEGGPPAIHHAKKHRVGTLIKERWPAYLIEVFVIILGITITLSLARVDSNLQTLLGRPDFASSDATFSDLKSSGGCAAAGGRPATGARAGPCRPMSNSATMPCSGLTTGASCSQITKKRIPWPTS